jgi:hypothetical protein
MLTLSGLGQTDDSGSDDSGYSYDPTDVSDCASDEMYVANVGCVPDPSGSGTSKPSWWEAPLTDITKGLTQGLFQDKGGSRGSSGRGGGKATVAAQPEAWYTTPTGMVGIGAGVLALVLLLRK